MKNPITIARAGGGTGGHIFPIKSLIQHLQTRPELKAKVAHMLRFGTAKSLEQESCHELQNKIKNLTFLPILS